MNCSLLLHLSASSTEEAFVIDEIKNRNNATMGINDFNLSLILNVALIY
ncbi:hypothetical protein XBFM1_1300003 [Xenorhabdus bovienii str. feltiae Moldova]|uniref:Uncharacterized protein n=1 Tax=Xenorhabdus bovienii str. feltiae Moldova TaxID=1398200 RepID=A0A077NN56_XENBV|nr:hypothetical protein XBFM1_1300003 [Xenorhabdus bovienii str. feltiae Moldova]